MIIGIISLSLSVVAYFICFVAGGTLNDIVSVLLFFMFVGAFVTGIVGTVLNSKAKKLDPTNSKTSTGLGLSIGGLASSAFFLLLVLVVIILMFSNPELLASLLAE